MKKFNLLRMRSSSKLIHQILLFYLLLFIITMSISLVIFTFTYNRVTNKKVEYATQQTINALNQNITNIINTVNGYSNLIGSKNTVQRATEHNGPLPTLLRDEAELEISEIVESFPFISSVHLYNNEINIININEHAKNINYPKAAQYTWWYEDVYKLHGEAKIVSSGVGPFTKDANPMISLIKIINSKTTSEPIGILIINFDLTHIMDNPNNFLVQYQPQIIIRGSWGNMIFNSAEDQNWAENVTSGEFPKYQINQASVNYKGQNYRISSMRNRHELILSLITPIDKILGETIVLGFLTIGLILLNGVLMYLGGILISKVMTTPLHKLVDIMKSSEEGILKQAEFKTRNQETTELVDGYNKLVLEIKKSIESEVEGEKRKRQMELQVMQAQIKPHFLYNTFDAISSLALEGKNREVYDAMIALGSFYSTSLNRGREDITIGEEIKTVQNYLNIQKIRYGDLFSAEFNIDDSTLKFRVLKLILQPLVENSLYHGLKTKGESGIIVITSKLVDNWVILSVKDDGIGMSDDKKKEVLYSVKNNEHINTFGLSTTIERMNLFYHYQNRVEIRDTPDGGTIIEFKIPIKEIDV